MPDEQAFQSQELIRGDVLLDVKDHLVGDVFAEGFPMLGHTAIKSFCEAYENHTISEAGKLVESISRAIIILP